MRTRVGNEDPILLDREMMFDMNAKEIRIGDGVNTFSTLTDIIRTDISPDVLANDPVKDLRKAVNEGTASTLYPIGTKVSIPYTDSYNHQNKNLSCTIVSYRKVTMQDGVERDAAIIQTDDVSPNTNILWDMESTDYPNGCNRYSISDIRQWLNSEKPANEWYSPQHESATAPFYANIDGFLRGFPTAFLALLKPVKVSTYAADAFGNVVDVAYDKVWLPSREEMFCAPDGNSQNGAPFGTEEGPVYEYWEQRARQNGQTTPVNDVNNPKAWLATGTQTTTNAYYLRSCHLGSTNIIWFIYYNGEVSIASPGHMPTATPTRRFYVRPCVAIF